MYKLKLWLKILVLAATLSGCQTIGTQNQQTASIANAPITAGPLKTLATTSPFPQDPAAAQNIEITDVESLSRLGRPPYPFETEQVIDFSPTQDEIAFQDIQPFADDLWTLTRNNLAFDLELEHPRIEAQLRWHKKHPKYLQRVSKRASRYYYYVLHEVLKRGLPAELALLPIVESAYDPFAYSHGRASGPWQFIPSTGKYFGLKKTWWYDGRRDIQASTQAALTYLTRLNKRFDGDWQLALAAYNAGGGNISKAIRYNRKRNRPTDFFSLPLPKETRAYVPKLIALAKVINDPGKYAIELTPIANEPYFTAVDTGSQIDLAQAADLAAISVDELYLLNPGFNQWATDPEGPHQLLIPANQAEIFTLALSELPKNQRVTWKRYKVRSGDSLIRIARNNKTTVQALRTSNNIKRNFIRAGQILMIPTASKNAKAYALSSEQRQEKKTQHIALRSGKKKIKYKVRSGDSFWTISRRYGVGVRELASWNQLAPGDPLNIGKTLVVWQPASTSRQSASTSANIENSRNIIRKVGYKVRNGDSLWLIANRFKVSVKDIKRWNAIKPSRYLKPGQQLTLYVDVTRAR